MVKIKQLPTTKFAGDYVVTGKYDMSPGEPSVPVLTSVEVSIYPDADPSVVARGITSGTMRRVESAVRELAAEADERGHGLRREYAHDAEQRLVELEGRSPRGDGTYYRDLLDASNLLRMAGDPSPVVTLAERLGRPRGTVANQLLTARREREDAIRTAEAEGLL